MRVLGLLLALSTSGSEVVLLLLLRLLLMLMVNARRGCFILTTLQPLQPNVVMLGTRT